MYYFIAFVLYTSKNSEGRFQSCFPISKMELVDFQVSIILGLQIAKLMLLVANNLQIFKVARDTKIDCRFK